MSMLESEGSAYSFMGGEKGLVMTAGELPPDRITTDPPRPDSGHGLLSFLGVGKSQPERAYQLNNNDWASEIPGPDISKADFYKVLNKVPLVYRKAMDDLAGTPLENPE